MRQGTVAGLVWLLGWSLAAAQPVPSFDERTPWQYILHSDHANQAADRKLQIQLNFSLDDPDAEGAWSCLIRQQMNGRDRTYGHGGIRPYFCSGRSNRKDTNGGIFRTDNLVGGNDYQWWICVSNQDLSLLSPLWQGISNDRCDTTERFRLPAPPQAVSDLRTQAPNNNTVTLTWFTNGHLADIVGYQVQYSRDGMSWATVDTSSLEGPRSQFSSPAWHGGYQTHYRVRPETFPATLYDELYGEWATVQTSVYARNPPRLPPRNLRVQFEGGNTTRPVVRWDRPIDWASAEIVVYRVFVVDEDGREITGTGRWAREVDVRVGTDLVVTFTGFTAGSTYRFRVLGKNPDDDETPASPVVVFGTPGTPTVTVEAVPPSLRFRWFPAATDTVPVDFWRVRVGSTGGPGQSNQTFDVPGGGDVRSFITPKLVAGTWVAELRGVNAVGQGPRDGTVITLTYDDTEIADDLFPPQRPRARTSDENYVFEWDAPVSAEGAGVDGYVVEHVRLDSGTTTEVDTAVNERSLTVATPLAPYQFTVRAKAGAERSDPSEPISIGGSSPPRNVTASGGDGLALLDWQVPDNPDGIFDFGNFAIYRSTVDDYELGEEIQEVATTTTSYLDLGVSNGTTYYYYVLAKGPGEYRSVTSSRATAEVSSANSRSPGTPSNVAAVGKLGKITISWAAPDDFGLAIIKGYRVFRSENGTDWATSPWRSVGASSREAEDTGLGGGVSRWYRVLANNAKGDGAHVTVSATTDYTPPTAPSALTLTVNSATSITVTWQAPDDGGGRDISGYQVERKLEDGVSEWEPQLLGSEGRTSLSYADTTVQNAYVDRYRYRVAAENSEGLGAYSDEVLTDPVPVPDAPADFAATLHANGLDVELVWTASTVTGSGAVTSYQLERSSDGGTTWEVLKDDFEPTATAHTDESTMIGNDYRYMLVAVNVTGPSTAAETADLSVPYTIDDWDMTGDGIVSEDDAIVLYYVQEFPNELGSSATAETAATLRRVLIGPLLSTSGDLAITRAVTLAESRADDGHRRAGDFNQDGSVDAEDAEILYYIASLPELVGGGVGNEGYTQFRSALIEPLAGEDLPTDAATLDAALREVVSRANQFLISYSP